MQTRAADRVTQQCPHVQNTTCTYIRCKGCQPLCCDYKRHYACPSVAMCAGRALMYNIQHVRASALIGPARGASMDKMYDVRACATRRALMNKIHLVRASAAVGASRHPHSVHLFMHTLQFNSVSE